MKPVINFCDIERFSIDFDKETVSQWILNVITSHGYLCSEINYSFHTDAEILKLNNTYLNHDFYTDIITFDNTISKTLSADIALSIDRIKDNAIQQHVDFHTELNRVMIHGVLHCMGFKDNSISSKQNMRQEEDKALEMFHVEHKTSTDNV